MEHLSEHWGSQLRIEALVYDIPKGAYLIKTLSSLTRCKTASPIILQRNNPGSSSHTYVGLSSSSHGSCSALLARIASHLTHPPPAIFIRIYQGWPLDLQEGPLPVHQANLGIPHLSPGHWLGQTAPSREPGHWSPLINFLAASSQTSRGSLASRSAHLRLSPRGGRPSGADPGSFHATGHRVST